MFAVTFCAKKRKKAAIKNLLGEPGVKVVDKHTTIIKIRIFDRPQSD
jgi:hypothetical protein